jgi:protein phosphatase
VRHGNEDTSLVDEQDGLWAVADGMGGHRAGEVASAIAVRTLQEAFRAVPPTQVGLEGAAVAANTAIRAAAEQDPELYGMGTTLVAIARTEEDELAYVNVGDSRIYLLRSGELQRLTIDHSLVEELVQEGSLTPEEARTHPKRNIVTRALGIADHVDVDGDTILPYTGDRYVLCSDGLTDEVEDDHVAGVLRRLADPDEAAAELVRLALEHGGRDNVTVLIVDVVDDGGRAEAASRVVTGGTASSVVRPPAEAPPPAPPAAPRRHRARAERPRRFTWRVAVFAVLLLAVLAAAAGAIGWYARNTYYVGVEGESVVVYKGKPGGVLWFDPTVESTTELTTDDLAPEARDDVARGVEFGSVEEAEAYLERVTTTTTTTTTSTTTSTTSTTTSTVPTTPTSV